MPSDFEVASTHALTLRCPHPQPLPPTSPHMALGPSPACLGPHPSPSSPLDISDPALVAAHPDTMDPSVQPGYPDTTLASALPPSSTSPTIAHTVSGSSYMDPTSQDDTIIAQPFSSPLPESTGSPSNEGDSTPASSGAQTPDIDPQILEALRSKDRIYVLKLGETFEALIMERRRVIFSP